MKQIVAGIVGGVGGLLGAGVCLLVIVGDIYWLFLSVSWGSFTMFFLGLFVPFAVITGPIGAWSLVFGAPAWLERLFNW